MDGRAGGVAIVAALPGDLASYLGTTVSEVAISTHYANKIVRSHQINFEDFVFIQKAIDKGYVLKGRGPKFLEFVLVDDHSGFKHYLLVLKTTKESQEVWIQTFHRTDTHRLRSKLRKLRLIRTHL